ncbi:MAG: hypothetical protein GEU83_17800 [Pseudonocardiaceae bacterium]|nr:hypothetical protein [Pseudonocardiaceae bacterium]
MHDTTLVGPGAPAGRREWVGLAVLALPTLLLDLRLFTNREFSVILAIMLVGAAVMGGSFLLVSLYLQMVEGLSPLNAGLWLLPMNLAMIAATLLAPGLVVMR